MFQTTNQKSLVNPPEMPMKSPSSASPAPDVKPWVWSSVDAQVPSSCENKGKTMGKTGDLWEYHRKNHRKTKKHVWGFHGFMADLWLIVI